jgi:ubiquitin C-terminal hydrolase
MNYLIEDLTPNPSGLYNTGSICYFNSLLQVLASCTSIQNITFYDKNETEFIFHKFINQVKQNKVDPFISNELIQALHKDLPTFGNGQESASEAFVLLINVIDNRELTELFIYRCRCTHKCLTCNYISNEVKDYSIQFDLFHVEELTMESILLYESIIDDYKCESCKNIGKIKRICRLTMLPEIVVVVFNIYYNKKIHSFPEYLNFPKSKLQYKLVGQIQHYGSLQGGHYTALALRKNKVYLFNDNNYEITNFKPTPETYIIFYHLIL